MVFQAGEVFYSRRNGGPAGGCTSDPISLGCPPGVGGLAEHGASGYLIDGEQTLSIRAINPLEVHGSPSTVLIDPATGQADRTVGFTAESELSMTDTRWYYRAGDTLPTPAGRGGAGEIGLPCALSPSCSYRPPTSGRMYARAQVAGNTVESHSEVVWVRADTLELTVSGAPDSVTQGDTVTFSSVDNFSGQNQRWTWVVEDTTAQPGLGGEVGDCGGESSCAYAPAATGRMHLTAFNAAGDSASAVSNLITVAPDVCAAAQSANGKLVAALEGTCEEELVVEVEVDRFQLHPRVVERRVSNRFRRGLGAPRPVDHLGQEPGRAGVSIRVLRGSEPVEAASVTLAGAMLAGSGGHAHFVVEKSIESSRLVDYRDLSGAPDDSGLPILGFFEDAAGARDSQFSADTEASGEVSATYVAGHVSGVMRITVTAESEGDSRTEVLDLTIAVPDLRPPPFLSLAYYVGWPPGNLYHGVAENWYLRPYVAGAAMSLAAVLVDPGQPSLMPQFNDASLRWGGTFQVGSLSELASGLEDHPWDVPHRSHRVGVDLDVGFCRVPHSGYDNEEQHRRFDHECRGTPDRILLPEAARVAERVGAYVLIERNHLHYTFPQPGLTRPGS